MFGVAVPGLRTKVLPRRCLKLSCCHAQGDRGCRRVTVCGFSAGDRVVRRGQVRGVLTEACSWPLISSEELDGLGWGAGVDPEAMVQSAGTAVVTLMATDGWRRMRDGVAALWRRVRPVQADEIEVALDETREEILAARRAGDAEGEGDLVRDWDRRLRRLLAEDPAVAGQLQQLLDDVRGSLPAAEQPALPSVRLQAHVSGRGRVYQAGRDQHITER